MQILSLFSPVCTTFRSTFAANINMLYNVYLQEPIEPAILMICNMPIRTYGIEQALIETIKLRISDMNRKALDLARECQPENRFGSMNPCLRA